MISDGIVRGGVGGWPYRRARATPRAVAFYDGDRTYTYADVYTRTQRLAAALHTVGVRRGARVAYLGPNHVAAPELLFATGVIGATYLPLNFRLAAPELAYILDDAAPDVLVWHEQFSDLVERTLELVAVPNVVRVCDNPDGTSTNYEAFLGSSTGGPPQVDVRSDDVAMIQYTSGTSGRPKGVMLSHGNLVWNAINLMVDVDLRTDDVSLVAAPLFHTAGMNNHLLTSFLKGGSAVLMAAWDPEEAIRLIERFEVTCLLGVPTMFRTLNQSPEWANGDKSSLRTVMCGGSPVSPALAREFRKLGLVFQPGYGLTETSPNATFLRAGMADEKAGTVGAPCFFTDVRIVGPDRRDLPAGEMGEVLVKGPNVTNGYWKREEATRHAISEHGWLRTGDIATFDEDGYVEIKDRLKDMIISGGENIYPAEVEAALYEHPGIAECAVIGKPDARWGEVGLAFVVPKAGYELAAAELEEHLSARLARYKVPKEYEFVADLPHNASGKLLKTELREWCIQDRARQTKGETQ